MKKIELQVDAEQGFDVCVGITRFQMLWIGTWPELYGKRTFLNYCYLFLPPSLLIFSLILPQAIKLYFVKTDFSLLLEILSEGEVILSICILKFIGICYRQRDLSKLVKRISDDWKNSDENEKHIMWRNAKLTRLITAIILTSLNINICLLIVRVLEININEVYNNPNKNEEFIRPPFLQTEFYFLNVQNTPWYEIVVAIQAFSCFVAAFMLGSFDGFFVLTILHFSGQLYNLQLRVENLMEDKQKKKCTFQEIFVPLIHRHRILCRCIEMLEENFNKLFLIQNMAVTVLICLQGYQFVIFLISTNNYLEQIPRLCFTFSYICSSLVSLFMYCYIAEQLRNESDNLYLSTFKMEWYKLSIQDMKQLIMFINKTSKPPEITVGKFTALSLEYFCTVLKTSAGYLSMLLALKDRIQLENEE